MDLYSIITLEALWAAGTLGIATQSSWYCFVTTLD